MKTDFQPGDVVEYCGDEAIVVANYGDGGVVDLGPGRGGGRCHWYWMFGDTPVTLVRRKDSSAE